ncbi:TIM barrel protein [Hoeflea sp. IMCC20628]|uniref:sugar phosphate isomerase/epimerase family protein n=1 Tax=Hoeflea sp. IMCC20628 TaxID=1620421 RepID=UPI001FD98C99|nr:TIM barrel protein [Hoeflea sp. IMCC20628]
MTAMQVLEFAIAEGCEVVQYADNLPLDRLDNSELEALATHARANGVALELGTQSFDAAQVKAYLDIAETIDARILRIALDAADAVRPVADLASEFAPLLERARQINCRIAIENHFNFPSQRMVELLLLVENPVLGVCLDVANSICAGEWPMVTVGILSPYAINLHLKDYQIVPDAYGVGFTITGRPMGEGRIDADAVLAALPIRDDSMSVIVEHWLPYQDDIAACRAMERDWTRKNLAAARRHMG